VIRLVVGLGNADRKYQDTLHNIGHSVINELLSEPPKRHINLEKSEGYMNSSGVSVKKFADRYKCDPTEVLIVCDDLDLPKGQPRIRLGGSSGGHRGLESIFEAFGGRTDIPRLRLGIGRPPGNLDPAEYVLKDTKEFLEAGKIIIKGGQVVRMAVDEGLEKAMNTFNQVVPE
jgi:PTH1 family peptidyl-tRNA hydrolase